MFSGSIERDQCHEMDELGKLCHPINPLRADPTKWSNALSVFDHFVWLALKGLNPGTHLESYQRSY